MARNTKQIGDGLRLPAVQEARRYPTPEMPSSKVAFSQPVGVNVVINNKIGHIDPLRPGCEQTPIHVGVLVGQSAGSLSTQVRGKKPNFSECRSRNDGISAHQLSLAGAERVLRP